MKAKDRQTAAKPGKKFLFDLNFFDDDAEDASGTDPDAPPPAPVYTEADIKSAEQKAFENGRRQGLQDAESSLQKAVEKQLAKIGEALALLIKGESARSKAFEGEAVLLCYHILNKVFPLMVQRHGADEIQNMISTILRKHAENGDILIHIHPSLKEAIETSINEVLSRSGTPPNCRINAAEAMTYGACVIEWSQGGAALDMTALAQQIAGDLEKKLTARNIKIQPDGDNQDKVQYDSESDSVTLPPQPATPGANGEEE